MRQQDKIKGTRSTADAYARLPSTCKTASAKLRPSRSEIAQGQSDGASATAAAASGENAVGTLPEEPLVREIVTDAVTNQNGETLVSESGRRAVKRQILKAIDKQTDVKIESVLMPDLTVNRMTAWPTTVGGNEQFDQNGDGGRPPQQARTAPPSRST